MKANSVHFDRALMRQLRNGRNLTLRDLAEMTGLSNPYLSQLETGRVTNPSLAAAVAIADAFDLEATAFVLVTAAQRPSRGRR